MNTDKTQKIKNNMARIALYPVAALHYVFSPITYAFARKNIGGEKLDQFAKLGFDLVNEATTQTPKQNKAPVKIATAEMNALVTHINRCERVAFTKELKTIEGQMSYKVKLDNTCTICGLCDMTGTAPKLIGDIRPQTAKVFVDGPALGDSRNIEINDMATLHQYITPAVMRVYKRMDPMDKLAALQNADAAIHSQQLAWLNVCAANARKR